MFTNDSVFVRHEPCPQCNSRDNLGVWSDGHKFCFGCGYFSKPDGTSLEIIKNRLIPRQDLAPTKLRLPDDASWNLPSQARLWLESYEIPLMEAVAWKLRWSESKKGLILPIYDNHGELVMYQIRNFNPEEPKPKYITYGKLGNYVPVYGSFENNGIVVVVEDYLSARKLAHCVNATPLLGSHFPKTLATRLSYSYERLLIWLDEDKAKEAYQFLEQYKYLFTEAEVLITPRDPKAHTDNEIFECVYGAFDYGDLQKGLTGD